MSFQHPLEPLDVSARHWRGMEVLEDWWASDKATRRDPHCCREELVWAGKTKGSLIAIYIPFFLYFHCHWNFIVSCISITLYSNTLQHRGRMWVFWSAQSHDTTLCPLQPLPCQPRNEKNMPRRLNLFQFTINDCGNPFWRLEMSTNNLLNHTMFYIASFGLGPAPMILYSLKHLIARPNRLCPLHLMQMVTLSAYWILMPNGFHIRKSKERWGLQVVLHMLRIWKCTHSDSERIPWGLASFKNNLPEGNLGIRSPTPFQDLPGLQSEQLQVSMSWLFLSACNLLLMLHQISHQYPIPFHWCLEWNLFPAIWSPACWIGNSLRASKLTMSRIQRGRGEGSMGARYQKQTQSR
jgi:hypothetical protein